MSEEGRTYQAGGALRPTGFYVERAADRQLLEALFAGEFAFVLATRQIGKSSLMVRTARRLSEHGIRTATIDLTAIGTSGMDPLTWFFALADEIAAELGLSDPEPWFEAGRGAAVQRWMHFLSEAVLPSLSGPLVLMIDEIDAVRSLPFDADDLFAAIRSITNRAARDPLWAHLTVALFGVATPWELVTDPLRTPFNVGRDVRIEDLTREEIRVLEPGLGCLPGAASSWMDEVFRWTRGHPYMTQRICALLSSRGLPGPPGPCVEAVVREAFLIRGAQGDTALQGAAQRMLSADRIMVPLYATALETGSATASEEIVRSALLTGMFARGVGGGLVVRNLVIESVFDARWLAPHVARMPHLAVLRRWEREGRQDRDALSGEALGAFRAWSEGLEHTVPGAVELLVRSVELERQREATEARSRLRSRFTNVLAVLLVALVLVLLLAVWSLDRQRRATADAEALALAAAARHTAGARGGPIDALAMAVDALDRAQGDTVAAEAEVALREVLGVAAGVRRRVYEGALLRVVCDPEGAQVAVLTEEETWWGGALGEVLEPMPEPPWAREPPRGLALDGADVVVALDGGPVRLTGEHSEPVLAAALAPDGTTAVTAADDDIAIAWDVATASPLARFVQIDATPTDVAICAERFVALIVDDSGGLSRFELLGGATLERAHLSARPGVHSVAWSAQGDAFVATGAGEILELSRAGTRVLSRGHPGGWVHRAPGGGLVLVGDDSERGTIISLPGGQLRAIGGVATRRSVPFRPDGAALVVQDDHVATILDTTSWEPLAVLDRHEGDLTLTSFDPAGERILTTSVDRTARIWDAGTGALLHLLEGHDEWIRWGLWSLDGEQVLTYGSDKRLLLWSAHTGALLHELEGHRGTIDSAVFVPGGEWIATAGFTDGTVRIWSIADGEQVASGLVGRGRLESIAASVDGRRLAAGTDEGRVHLWELGSMARLGSHDVGPQRVKQLSFTIPGELQVMGTHGRLRVLPATREATRALACGLLDEAGRTCGAR